MKNFFSRNRKVVEILLTLMLVFITAGYYYLIYIPERESEIIERRFRTLQRVEENSRQKFQGYLSTIKNCIVELDHYDSSYQGSILDFYKSPGKFSIVVEQIDSINKKDSLITILPKKKKSTKDKKDENNLDLILKLNETGDISSINVPQDTNETEKNFDKNNPSLSGFKVLPDSTGRNLVISYDSLFEHSDFKRHYRIKATINYKEFITPLLRQNVFDHYLVFSNTKSVYEDFPSGFSFENLDSLFNSKDKIYSSRIINIETGGEKYLAFLHPYGYTNKNDRIVMGLLSQKAFDKEKRQLPEYIVTAILFITLFSLILIPVLKLYLMGKKERLSIGDLLFNYNSMMLIISVILLVFLRFNETFLPTVNVKKDSKYILANQMSKSLLNEIDSAYTLLDAVDRYYIDCPPGLQSIKFKNLKNAKAGVGNFSKSKQSKVDSSILYDLGTLAKKYKNAFRISWIKDTTGREVVNWSYTNDNPGGSFKDRAYFKNIEEHKTLSLRGDVTKQYAIQPIISWNDGNFRVIISKQSQIDTLVALVSCNFKSVINPVMPLGYSFAITDANGEVIFDSDTTHNLNENLLQELIDPEPLKTALHTKTQQKFTTVYEEKEVSALVQPIKGLPYFIVIFYDEAYTTAQHIKCLSFTFTMLLALFLFACIEVFLIFLCYHRDSKLLKNNFDISWIYPFKNCSAKYLFVFLFNSGLFIILVFFCAHHFSMNNLINYIFLFLTSIILSCTATCWVQADTENSTLEDSNKETIQNITLKKTQKNAVVLLLILALIILMTFCYYSGWRTVTSFPSPLIFTFVSIALFVILYIVLRKSKIQTERYVKNFRLMVFSKLVLTGTIPIFVFYIISYNFEQHLHARLKLFHYAENIKQQVSSEVSLDTLVSEINSDTTIKNFYTDSNWVYKIYAYQNPVFCFDPLDTIWNQKTGTSSFKNLSADPYWKYKVYTDFNLSKGPYATNYETIDSVCIDLLKSIHLHYNDISASTENLEIMKPYESDSSFLFSSIFNEASDTAGDSLEYKISEANNNLAQLKYLGLVSSGTIEYNMPLPSLKNIHGWVFWILLLVCMWLVYELITYSINKIYGLRVPEIDYFRKANNNLILNKNIKRLFLKGIPGTAKIEYLRNELIRNDIYKFNKEDNKKENNVYLFDLIQIPDEIMYKDDNEKLKWDIKVDELYKNENITCIIFNHFEYKILDEHTNRLKFNLIEKFMTAENERKIIISSNIDPVEFIRSLKKYELASSVKKENGSSKKSDNGSSLYDGLGQFQNAVGYENVHRWINMLGMFTNVYSDPDICEYNSDDKKSNIDFISEECKRNVNLVNIRKDFSKYITDDFQNKNPDSDKWEKEDDCILKIQSYSDHTYRYIWTSLTHEEQLALYDLAEDGLMNTTNNNAMIMLLNKGLIRKKDGMFTIMNKSFRNFILTIVSSDEINIIEKEIHDSKTWNDYKYPVLIIVVALLSFVLTSNPEKFGNVLPVITAVVAGITTLVKLMSYMKPGESSS